MVPLGLLFQKSTVSLLLEGQSVVSPCLRSVQVSLRPLCLSKPLTFLVPLNGYSTPVWYFLKPMAKVKPVSFCNSSNVLDTLHLCGIS